MLKAGFIVRTILQVLWFSLSTSKANPRGLRPLEEQKGHYFSLGHLEQTCCSREKWAVRERKWVTGPQGELWEEGVPLILSLRRDIRNQLRD